MISLLILVQHLDVVRVNITSPLYIKVLIVALDHVETSILARVHDSIIDVCRI